MTLLSKIEPYKQAALTDFVSVKITDIQIGWTPRHIAVLFSEYGDAWHFEKDTLSLNARFTTFEERTGAIDSVFIGLANKGLLPQMPDYSMVGDIDWYEVRPTLQSPPVCIVKRFYSTYLGIKMESILLHGYSGNTYIAAKRSKHVHDAPNKLDLMSAGSVTHGYTVYETLLHEAHDEAGLEPYILKYAVKVTQLDFCYLTSKGLLKHEYFHVYDLDLGDMIKPKTLRPIEVEGFYPMSVESLLHAVEHTDQFKPEIIPSIIDFLIRHKHISTDHIEYQKLNDVLAMSCEPALCCAA